MTFFKTTFEGNEGPVHGGGMGDDMWMNMLSAQVTWDATMGFNSVEALKAQNDPKAIMVVLVGSGHVAYGLGIERQARKWFDGPIATLIPVSVGTRARGLVKSTQASYANFTWGVPDELDSAYPSMGTSTAVGTGDAQRRVIIVQEDSPGAQAGVKVGDVMQSLDGVPLTDKETFSRLMAAKRWGDSATLVVTRGTETVTLKIVFRRTIPEK
jgi:membrane-associated protease RseP (regulator of RpoE activity)